MKNQSIEQWSEERIAKLTVNVLGASIGLPAFFVIMFSILNAI
jgi:hypothetical protein